MPKILIISHNPLTTYESMGKTFSTLLGSFASDEICQLYIYPTIPNLDSCNSYFRITDKDVLQSYYSFRVRGRIVEPNMAQSEMFENAEDEQLYRNPNNKKSSIMLGAVRHGGFIPWDDDIDVVLPRPDYDRLISMFTEKEDHFLLESPYTGNKDYYYTFAKLYDTDTTLTEKSRRNCRRGIYIDVFPLDGVGKSELEMKANFAKIDRLNMFLMTRICAITKDRSFYKNASIVVSRLIPSFVVNDRKLVVKVDKLAASFGYEGSLYVANLMGTYRKKEVMEKRIFGKPTEYKFENIVVDGVEHYDEFLTHIYGDWRKLPPENKRKTAHEYLEMNLQKSWLE